VENSDREEAKTEATRSNATAIANRDNVVEMIGQALSAITLGIAPGNGRKNTFPGTPQRRLDGQQIVKERLAGVKSGFLRLPQGSGDALRTADNTTSMALAVP
jgi:hypothetical protein